MRWWSLVVLFLVACPAPKPTPAPRPDCPLVPPLAPFVEYELADGRGAKVEAGDGFVREAGSTRWTFIETLYSPTWYEDAYEVTNCDIVRRDGEVRVPVRRAQRDDFDGGTDAVSLFGPERGWTAVTLQSPSTPTIPDYVALRNCLFARTCDFRDNRLDLVDEPGRGRVLRATAVAKGSLITSKASFESGIMYFVKGDVVTARLKVRVVSGMPFSLIDLESSFVSQAPGPRLILSRGRSGTEAPHLAVELKFLDKPTYEPTPAQLQPFPVNEWVDVELVLRLDDGPDGTVRVRQNGVVVVEARGKTLPLPDSVLDSLELGITATDVATVVDVDAIDVSASR
jgi:hypothetical protein